MCATISLLLTHWEASGFAIFADSQIEMYADVSGIRFASDGPLKVSLQHPDLVLVLADGYIAVPTNLPLKQIK